MLARSVLILASMMLLAAPASAENCDQTLPFPNYPGPGPKYKGVSRIPTPPSGPTPVVQWVCFFKNTERILSVSSVLIDPKGNPAPYFQYSADFNYTYYPDQTAIKSSLQKIQPQVMAALKRGGWSLSYEITFEQPASHSNPSLGSPAIACGSTNLCVGISPKGDFWFGNPRGGMTKQGNLYEPQPPPSTPKQFSVACSEPEYCVALDNDGNVFSGAIRDKTGDFFKKR